MKKVASKFSITAIIAVVIVGALALAAWFLHVALKNYLNTPHTYGSVKVMPYGHSMEDVLSHSFDSLEILANGNRIFIRDFALDITLFSENRGVVLKSADVNIALKDSSETTEETKIPDLIFPEKAKFYVPLDARVGTFSFTKKDLKYTADSITLQSYGTSQFEIQAQNIQGNYIARPAQMKLVGDFSNAQVNLSGSIFAGKDEVHFSGKAPKKNLKEVATTLDVDVKNIEDWIPVELPEKVPDLGKLKIETEAQLNAQGKPNYKLHVETRVGAFWPLEDLNVFLDVNGDDKKFHAEILLKNDEGGSIFLESDMDTKLNGTASGYVNQMNALFGPQMMPLDMTIHSAVKTGDLIDVQVETRQGSYIEAAIHLEDEFYLTYVGDMSPYEPWALDWSKERLVFKDRYKIYGSFGDGKMKALVKIDTIPFAYQMTADSLQTTLVLDRTGIDFTSGTIYTPKEIFDFTGDIRWRGERTHTSWQMKQRNGGYAEVYITIIDSVSIYAKADSVEVSTIPFAKVKLSDSLQAKVTGEWYQNFDKFEGNLDAKIEGSFAPFDLQGHIKAHQNGDSVFIEKFEASQKENTVSAEAVFILPNDSNPDFSPTGNLPIQVVHAWMSSKEFNIPLLLLSLNDTTFKSGYITGDLAFSESVGLQGNVKFSDIQFNNIPPQLLTINRMNLFAEKNKIELGAYLGIGGGGWTGSTQIIVDDIFQKNRHVSVSHSSENGGDLYAEGFIDSAFTLRGALSMTGSWFVPGTVSEIQNTDLKVDVTAKLRDGLKGITAEIYSDETLYQPPKIDYVFPIKFRGHMEDGILNISKISTQNDSGEVVNANLEYDLNTFNLNAINFDTERYSLNFGPHKIVVENVSGSLEQKEEGISINANLPQIRYQFHHETFGDGEALAHSNLNFNIPKNEAGLIQNKSIDGNLTIDKLVYYKTLDIEVTPRSIDKFFNLFNNVIAKLRKQESETKISVSNPINLSVHVSSSQIDSTQILTPFATFPLTFDLWVLGNTSRPLLRGDIMNSNEGFIGVQDIYEFDLNAFRISWNDVPWQHGIIDVTSSQELPYCSNTDERNIETCPVNFDIEGTITNPQPNPNSNCGNENSAAAIYYNIFLGCIAEDGNENTDWNKLAGKAIGKVISSTANRTLGGDYIGDIDMKVMLFNNSSINEKDSSYFKVPFSLDRWVKNLSLIFGYTQDQSENPTYDQSLQFGINYLFPVFQGSKYSHKNHLTPQLSIDAQLVSKQYLTNTDTENNENRVEKNIGINYVYRYWNPCLLGIGKCEDLKVKRKELNK